MNLEYRRYRKDIKRRAKQAINTSRQLLEAKARIIELEASAASTELRHRSEVEQAAERERILREHREQMTELARIAKQEAADSTLRLRVLEDAVRSAAKLLPPDEGKP